MIRPSHPLVLAGLLVPLALTPPAMAQPAAESLAAWAWSAELTAPAAGPNGRIDCLLTPAVLDKADPGLHDLRLYDAQGREVPYALRVRRTRSGGERVEARSFNQVRNPDRTVESRFDLGTGPVEHNSVVVGDSSGSTNYRRKAQLQGSDDNAEWRTLVDNGQLVQMRVGGQAIDARTLTYPASRYRYLRLRVWPDPGREDDAPAPPTVTLFRAREEAGEDVVWPVAISPREPVPTEGGPGSAWFLTIADEKSEAPPRVPWELVTVVTDDDEFARPYRLVTADPEGGSQVLTEGTWRRGRGDTAPLILRFPETTARRLRLVVTDNRNAPLRLSEATSATPARQLVFTPPADSPSRFALYFGNPSADPPAYDYAANLPATLDPPPARGTLGPPEANPSYTISQPPPPWTERFPWIIYVALTLACLVLLAILVRLGRRATARHDARPAPTTG